MDNESFDQVKSNTHRILLSQLDLERLSSVNNGRARQAVAGLIQDIILKEKLLLNSTEKERLQADLLDEVFGFGPLEPLLKDPTISDILVNRKDLVYIERAGVLSKTDVKFRDDRHLLQIIDRIVGAVGRRVDESSPMVDARLADGSRVNAIIPPLSLDGPALSIRRFGTEPLTAERMLELKSLSPEILEVLAAAVKARISILISGGTGAGKTTFLNMLSNYIPETERLVTIEDAAELQIQQENVVRLETRPPNVEGKGAVRQRQLLINSLRMRPDRIIIGEVRGEEAFDMLQAMNTGHEGSMTTIHANTCRDALARLESMVAMATLNLPERAVRQQIVAALTLVVQITRLSDGSRRVVNVAEITGMESDMISMQDIFTFVRRGIGPSGRVAGVFRPTGIRPKFLDKLRVAGIVLPLEIFEKTLDVS
jgi:pilus assembly protein CpaF